MEITGRLTADAAVKAVGENRKVVNFSIAVNDSYRSGGETKRVTTYFDCSYWLNSGIAEYLKKGGLVQLYGRVGVNAYISGTGEAKASLTFHSSEVKLLGAAVGGSSSSGNASGVEAKSDNNHNNPGNGDSSKAGKGSNGTDTIQANPYEGLDKDLPF